VRLGGRWLGAPQAIIWDLSDGRVAAEFVGPPAEMPNLIWSLDPATVLWVRPGPTAKADPVVTITDVPTGKPRLLFDAPGLPREPALSADGRVLAAAVRGDVVVWSLDDAAAPAAAPAAAGWRRWFGRPAAAVPPLRPRLVLSAGAERVDAVAFTPDGRRLLTGTAAGTVREWDVPDFSAAAPDAGQGPPKPRAAYDWGVGPVTTLAFAPDGLTAAAGGETGRVVVWDVEG
jgi:WD40 repeat protein